MGTLLVGLGPKQKRGYSLSDLVQKIDTELAENVSLLSRLLDCFFGVEAKQVRPDSLLSQKIDQLEASVRGAGESLESLRELLNGLKLEASDSTATVSTLLAKDSLRGSVEVSPDTLVSASDAIVHALVFADEGLLAARESIRLTMATEGSFISLQSDLIGHGGQSLETALSQTKPCVAVTQTATAELENSLTRTVEAARSQGDGFGQFVSAEYASKSAVRLSQMGGELNKALDGFHKASIAQSQSFANGLQACTAALEKRCSNELSHRLSSQASQKARDATARLALNLGESVAFAAAGSAFTGPLIPVIPELNGLYVALRGANYIMDKLS